VIKGKTDLRKLRCRPDTSGEEPPCKRCARRLLESRKEVQGELGGIQLQTGLDEGKKGRGADAGRAGERRGASSKEIERKRRMLRCAGVLRCPGLSRRHRGRSNC